MSCCLVIRGTWEVEALATCLARGRSARLAFGTAARVWSLAEGQDFERLHVLVPMGVHRHTDDRVEVHHTRRLANSDIAVFDRLPVTTVARTILDLATVLSADRVERLVDDALVRDLTTVPLLSASLQRNGGSGRVGTVAVRKALDEWSAGPLESHAEVDLARWLRRTGLPRPVRQFEIGRPDGTLARVDFAWPARHVALEMDGFAHHHGPRKLAADHERRAALSAQGWLILTTTPGELRQGAPALRAALQQLVGSAGRPRSKKPTPSPDSGHRPRWPPRAGLRNPPRPPTAATGPAGRRGRPKKPTPSPASHPPRPGRRGPGWPETRQPRRRQPPNSRNHCSALRGARTGLCCFVSPRVADGSSE